MKTVKKICYSIGVLLLLMVMIFMCTAVIQLAMVSFIDCMDIKISDDTLYSVSGTVGIALAGIIISGYIRKKQYQNKDIDKQKIDVKKLVLYGVLAVLHGYNLLGIASCFLAGIFFVLVYEHTGNVRYSIFTHFMCNLFTLTFNTMEQKDVTLMGSSIQYEINGYNSYNIVVILIAVMFCMTVYVHKTKLEKVKADERHMEKV